MLNKLAGPPNLNSAFLPPRQTEKFFRISLTKLEKQSFAPSFPEVSKFSLLWKEHFPFYGWGKPAWLGAPHGAGAENHLLKVSPIFHFFSFRRQTILMQVNIILSKIKQATLGKEFCYLDAVRKFSLFFFFIFLVQVLKINHFNLCSLVNMQL